MINLNYKFEIAPKMFENQFDYRDSRDFCQMVGIDGKNDWYLPSLQQIGYYDDISHTFELDAYWVSDDNFVNERKLTFDFSTDDASLLHWHEDAYCRPFRDLVIDNSLIDQIEFTVIDQCMTWDDARLYCFSLNIDGKTGWRLPTIEELDSLHHTKKLVSCLDFWSSKTYENEVSVKTFKHGLRNFATLDSFLPFVAVRDVR
jgi:hypothetical protein